MSHLVDDLYEVVKEESVGLDSIYEAYIVHLIGVYGLNVLKKHNLLETCGVINGRQLYVLCEKETE